MSIPKDFSKKEKLIIRDHLLDKGFESFESWKEWLALLPTKTAYEIQTIFDKYKKDANKDDPFYLISSFLSKKGTENISPFYDLFANVLRRKAESMTEDKEHYREAYFFLATLLEGEIPKANDLSDRAVVILIMLTQNLNYLVENIELSQVVQVINQQESGASDSQEKIKETELMAKLMQQTKLRQMSNFLNPLNISPAGSEIIFERLFTNFDDNIATEGNEETQPGDTATDECRVGW